MFRNRAPRRSLFGRSLAFSAALVAAGVGSAGAQPPLGGGLPTTVYALDNGRGPKPTPTPTFTPGAPGAGDPYFPLDGNGGYDVAHYDLAFSYDPPSDTLDGVATITAVATQDLSAFDLDLHGLTVSAVSVGGVPAGFSRDGQELIITPATGIVKGAGFTVVVSYSGAPGLIDNPVLGSGGVFHTDDGLLISGEPHVASTWFPVNDHPSDAASYSFAITVPEGLEVIANGELAGSSTAGGWTTWNWVASAPMAPYLATVTIGDYEITTYKNKGIQYLDAIHSSLFKSAYSVHSGTSVAISQHENSSYKRLARAISVPTEGAWLTFWVARDTEQGWDHFFVEAHTVGLDDWTTLPAVDATTGDPITSTDTGNSCPYSLPIHPFLTHYQTDNGDGTCSPTGTTGAWNAVTGLDTNWVQWSVDLSAYAGSRVEIVLAYASDDVVQGEGVVIDDIVVSTGEGSTSFEEDGDVWDGWSVPGAPGGSPGNVNDWIVGGQDQLPPGVGDTAAEVFSREPEIVDFLSANFGKYPFSAAGGIVGPRAGLGWSIENQTRPVYSPAVFLDPDRALSVVVHELTHQWFGDSVRLARWSDIWLNEGFATYAMWLWAEHEGGYTPQDRYDSFSSLAPDDPFWELAIGDPGRDNLFLSEVYHRGALTLHALRLQVGDDDFFKILQKWARTKAGQAVTTADFVAVAEDVSKQQLDDLFTTWLSSGYPLA